MFILLYVYLFLQKGLCVCMYNWTDVVLILIIAGQVQYLFLLMQQLLVIA